MNLAIRHVEPEDFVAIREIYTYPGVIAGTLQIPYPSVELWRKRVAEPGPEHRALVAVVDGELVGHLGLDLTSRRRRLHAAYLGMAVRDDHQGRGIGSALLGTAVSLADGWLNLLRLELNVFVDNHAAIALYRKFGFVVEGTHRAFALRAGAYVDTHSMARLHPRPPVLGGS